MATVPTVAAVATLEPEVAAKRALAPMFACISPPGSHDSHRLIEPYIFSARPERSRISPSMMNRGMATSRNSLLVLQVTSPMARESGRSEEHTSELQSLMRQSYAVFCL